MIISTEMNGNIGKIIAEVPLAETFGYSTDLRSMTQGPGHVHDGVQQVPPGADRTSRQKSSPSARRELQPA